MNNTNIGASLAYGESEMPASPVDQQITDVQNVSATVKALIKELEGKMNSVLTPISPVVGFSAGESKAAVQRSPLAGKLSGVASSLDDSASELRSLINRLEI